MKHIRALLLLIAFGLLCAGAAAHAAQKELPQLRPITVDYAVYIGGLHLLDARFSFAEGRDRYEIKAAAKTRGLWKKIVPWESNMMSEGRIEGDRFVPAVHKNVSRTKKKTKTVSMWFDDNRNIAVEFDPPEKASGKRTPVTEEQKRSALDPMSGILQLLGDLAVNKSCSGTEPIFDGKRRFDLTATDKGFGDTDPGKYGMYRGKARVCDIEFKMIAGEWKDRERSKFWQTSSGQKGREPFRVWLASFAPDLPELAVRAESQSFWGAIVIHMIGWQYGDQAR